MDGSYDAWRVTLSIGVAVLASYVALDLASRVAASRGTRAAGYWLVGGALSMGTGIWSMHFIGMLAFELPIPMSYDVPVTLFSLVLAVLVSGFALQTVSAGALRRGRLLVAGICMGAGITAMHYTGMAAMEMLPAIRYDSLLFVSSAVIAVAASVVALWIAFRLRSETLLSSFWKKAGAALIMGGAIAGMHYTGMAAAIFAPDSFCTASPQTISNGWLAVAIGTFSFMFLATTLLVSVFDARLADRSTRLAESLRKANVDLATHSVEVTRINERLREECKERALAEAALREGEERYRSLFELSPDGILIHRGGTILLVNQRCARLLGAASREDLIGKPLVDVLHPSSRDVALEHVRQVVEEKRTTSRLEERMITLDGRAIDVEVSATPLLYERKPSILAVLHDITERKIADQQLAFLAQYDALTGLPNRALFRDRLSLALARAVRKKRPLAVLFVNLDHFKETNDSLGRGAGDEVLLATAALLKDTLSDVDTIARLGGDEFTVILESIDDAHHAAALAERVKQAFANPFQLRGQDIFVTASMGISFHSPEAHDVDALLQTAEIAMYHAKDAGRNGFVFYAPEMNAEAGRRLNMTALLRRALERQELILHYQPKCDTRTGRIVGVEALARIDSDELGLIPAARFIPLAEETGLIFPIGEWALRTACTQVKAWQWRGFPPLTVSVNLSPRQLQQNDLVKTIANVLEQTGLDGHLLELEITEVMAMRNLDEYIERLKAIRRLGVTLAIDDFGTGYSSLAHLAKLPIRALKIDHSFTLAMQENPDAMTLVSTILTLARSLGLKVIAEGVETKEQEKILRLLRCDEIQGYFVSRPLSAEAIPGFLNRNQTRLAHAQQSRETAAIAS